jgi:flagellar biosynthetic protein FliR
MPPFMPNEVLIQTVLVHLLVSIRFLALFFTASAFMFPAAPNIIRLLLSVSLAVIVTPFADISVPLILFSSWPYVIVMGVREALIGASIGFISSLPVYAMQFSGFFDSTVMGFTMMNIMDPLSNAQVAVLAQLKNLLAVWFFLRWDGHMMLVQGLVESIRMVPPGAGMWGAAGTFPWTGWLQSAFTVGLRMSMSVIGAVLLAEVGLGFVARTVPQMNVFVLGIPLKIAIGMMVLIMVLPSTVDIFHQEIERALVWALEGIHYWR